MDDADVTDSAGARTARRAYYGAISYRRRADRPRAPGAARAPGWPTTRIVVLPSDHGEMLGERGLWYKMSFFEPALPRAADRPRARPLRAAPGGGRRVARSTSCRPASSSPHDGASPDLPPRSTGAACCRICRARGGHDEAIGEYLAEGAIAPIVMIRRGRQKFVHSPGRSRPALRPCAPTPTSCRISPPPRPLPGRWPRFRPRSPGAGTSRRSRRGAGEPAAPPARRRGAATGATPCLGLPAAARCQPRSTCAATSTSTTWRRRPASRECSRCR